MAPGSENGSRRARGGTGRNAQENRASRHLGRRGSFEVLTPRRPFATPDHDLLDMAVSPPRLGAAASAGLGHFELREQDRPNTRELGLLLFRKMFESGFHSPESDGIGAYRGGQSLRALSIQSGKIRDPEAGQILPSDDGHNPSTRPVNRYKRAAAPVK